MAEYKLEVSTGDQAFAGTLDCIYVTLIGTEGESERTHLDNFGIDFIAGKKGSYNVKTSLHLGQLLLVKLEKDATLKKLDNAWFCSKIVVTTPEDDVILFPCYRWVSDGERVELRGGKAMKAFEDDHSLLTDHRKKELTYHNDLYQWGTYFQRLPHISTFKDSSEIPDEDRFSVSKTFEFAFEKQIAIFELKLKGMNNSTKQWEDVEAMKNVFWFKKTPMSEYVSEHWMEDDFYGFQFLNGINPNMIQRCLELPHNFPVTEEMVKPFLDSGSSLQREMEKGNIFLCDYKGLVGLSTKVDNGEVLPLTPGLCLFYMNPEKKLMPIAIQLTQQPSEQNPIFLPSDPECDWLLAKMFVKHADGIYHQFVYHLLNTHFLAEAFAVATLRSFPVIHPLYKLLIPHFRYTFQINVVGRQILLSPGGPLYSTSLTPEGLIELMGRAHSETTYSSLCLPENIRARGLESVPNFYYRDDGLKLWNIINSFVRAIVKHYYPLDNDVCRDSELQDWINQIFTQAFLGNKSSGIPAAFHTVEEVIKFITMLIFNVSGQHAAVHLGQFDYECWIPNSPLLLRKAPPTIKGQSSMKTMFETLPTVGETVTFMVSGWVLSKKYKDSIPLGLYPDEHFDEPAPKQMIKEFQAELSFLSEAIAARNTGLVVPYNYLNPTELENSITM